VLTRLKDLPKTLLDNIGVQQVGIISVLLSVFHLRNPKSLLLTSISEQTYRELSSLRKPGNGILLVFVFVSTYTGRTLSTMRDWVSSEDGQLLYQQLLIRLRCSGPPAELALLLAALLSLEQFHSYIQPKNARPSQGNDLANWNFFLKGQPTLDAPIMLENVCFSFILAVQRTVGMNESRNIFRLLGFVFDVNGPILESSDLLLDQYWMRKFRSHLNHDQVLYAMLEDYKLTIKSISALVDVRETQTAPEANHSLTIAASRLSQVPITETDQEDEGFKGIRDFFCF